MSEVVKNSTTENRETFEASQELGEVINDVKINDLNENFDRQSFGSRSLGGRSSGGQSDFRFN